MESGEIVEYIDDQKIICALVMESGNQRIRLLTEQNKEVRLAAQRLAHRGTSHLNPSLDKPQLVESLRALSKRRDAIADSIDIEDLWEVLKEEQAWIDLKTMTGLCFPASEDDDHESGVIRALFKNKRYFKFKPDRFLPHTQSQLEEILLSEKKAQQLERLIKAGVKWIVATLSGTNVELPDCCKELIDIFQSYYLHEKESPYAKTAREILKRSGQSSTDALFHHLVAVGVWGPDENVDLQRYKIKIDFPEPAHELAKSIPEEGTFFGGNRVDLTSLNTITIDGQSTQDFDDALSIESKDGFFLVGIHISDVAHSIKKDDALDVAARARGSSIYLPDHRIPMIPPILAENRLSLKKNHVRPTISTMVKINKTGDIISYDIFPSVIRVRHQLSYFDANLYAEEGKSIGILHEIASRFRDIRLSQGATQITLPEVTVWIDDEGAPTVNRVNRESPGRLLVAEMMIMSNWLSARFLAENGIPGIFRSQPKPKNRILKNGAGTLFQNWMQRKHLNRFALRTRPEKHCGLGLDAYVTATSPIRKYFDLVTQRQIRSLLGLEATYTEKDIEKIIEDLNTPMANVGRIQFRRNRYWLLKCLEKKIGKKEEAIVLQRRRNAYSILLTAYMIECFLPQSSGIDLKPEDLVQVTIQHVNARRNTLSVFMG